MDLFGFFRSKSRVSKAVKAYNRSGVIAIGKNDLGKKLLLDSVRRFGGRHVIGVGQKDLTGSLNEKSDFAGLFQTVDRIIVGFEVERHGCKLCFVACKRCAEVIESFLFGLFVLLGIFGVICREHAYRGKRCKGGQNHNKRKKIDK